MKCALQILAFILIALVFSCTKYSEPISIYEDATDTTRTVKKKVLLIAIDGLSAKVSKSLDLANINNLKENGIYTYEAISDYKTTDAASWVSLMTGNSHIRHRISDSSFKKEPAKNNSSIEDFSPDLFNIISTSKLSFMKTALISNWSALETHLCPDVKHSVIIKDDKAAADSAVNILSSGSHDAVVVNLNGPALAGLKFGFNLDASQYIEAIKSCDEHIGKMVAALKQSPTKDLEDWLVIITGTHGGSGFGYGGNLSDEYTVFTLYHNHALKKSEITRGNFISGFEFTQPKNRKIFCDSNPDEVDFMNIKASDTAFTLQFWIKGSKAVLNNNSVYWDDIRILSKRKYDGLITSPGWELMLETGTYNSDFPNVTYYAVPINSTPSTQKSGVLAAGREIFDNNWHHITMFMYHDEGGGVRNLRFLVDGVFSGATKIDDIAYKTDFSNDVPFSIGLPSRFPQESLPFTIKELMFFNVQLTEEEIKSNMCIADIKTHPRYDKLKAYYKFDEGFGTEIINHASPGVGNLYVNRPPKWTGVKLAKCFASPTVGQNNFQMTNLDIVPNILYWYNVDVENYTLSGSNWLSNFF